MPKAVEPDDKSTLSRLPGNACTYMYMCHYKNDWNIVDVDTQQQMNKQIN